MFYYFFIEFCYTPSSSRARASAGGRRSQTGRGAAFGVGAEIRRRSGPPGVGLRGGGSRQAEELAPAASRTRPRVVSPHPACAPASPLLTARVSGTTCGFLRSPPPKGLISCVFFLACCVSGQTDGESEEEQESAGTGEEDEDGDESDLVTQPRTLVSCPVAEHGRRLCRPSSPPLGRHRERVLGVRGRDGRSSCTPGRSTRKTSGGRLAGSGRRGSGVRGGGVGGNWPQGQWPWFCPVTRGRKDLRYLV